MTKSKTGTSQKKITVKKKSSVKKKPTVKLTFETAKMSRDDVAVFLLRIAKERNLVAKRVNMFKSHSHFRSIYTYSNLQGILLHTIAKIVNSFETFILTKKGKAIPKSLPSISCNLNLETYGYLTGYLINAYSNNISKDYKRWIADKREGITVSIDTGAAAGGESSAESNLIYFNRVKTEDLSSKIVEFEYKKTIGEFIQFLRLYDKKMNNVKSLTKEKSNLAYIFIYLLKPELKGKFIFIKDKIKGCTPYSFKIAKETIVSLLKREFKDKLDIIFEHISSNFNKPAQPLAEPKKTKVYNNKNCEVKTMFKMEKRKKDKIIFSFHAFITRTVKGKQEIIKKIRPLKMEGLLTDYTEIKLRLEADSRLRIEKLTKESNKLKAFANKNLYKVIK